MADGPKIIAEVGIDAEGNSTVREPIRIALATFRNTKFVDVRKYYKTDDGWQPTKKGITLQKDQVAELIEKLQEKNAEIQEWFK